MAQLSVYQSNIQKIQEKIKFYLINQAVFKRRAKNKSQELTKSSFNTYPGNKPTSG
jgi:hypothetical protein